MSRANETRHIKWHKTCKCKCRLDASICNNKQRWNDDKCRCERKELIAKGMCDKGFIWNPSNCECECYKSCDIGEYLNYKNCRCRKKIIDKLLKIVEECSENIDGNEMLYNETLDIIPSSDNKTSNSCVVYITLFSLFLIIINIKSRTYYFYNDLINIKNFNNNKLKLDKKGVLGNDVYYIGYIIKKPQWHVFSVNPLYLIINKIKGHFEEVDGDKYLIISSENGNIIQKYQEVFDEIKEIIKK